MWSAAFDHIRIRCHRVQVSNDKTLALARPAGQKAATKRAKWRSWASIPCDPKGLSEPVSRRLYLPTVSRRYPKLRRS